MTDNFDLISKLLLPDHEDQFYHLQILRRGKDHPDLPSANRVIKTYYINGPEHLSKYKDEIIGLCEFFGARAYINVAPKSMHKLSLTTLAYLASRLRDGDHKKIYKAFSSVAGEMRAVTPRFVIDVDDKDIDMKSLLHCIDNFCRPYSPKYVATIPTKNGYHLITYPFNVDDFKKYYPDIDIHKNNPTILYVPKSLD